MMTAFVKCQTKNCFMFYCVVEQTTWSPKPIALRCLFRCFNKVDLKTVSMVGTSDYLKTVVLRVMFFSTYVNICLLNMMVKCVRFHYVILKVIEVVTS